MLKFIIGIIVAIPFALAILSVGTRSQPYPESISGVIKAIDAQEITLETAPGALIVVDISAARHGDHIGTPIAVGRHVIALGRRQSSERFIASALHKGMEQ